MLKAIEIKLADLTVDELARIGRPFGGRPRFEFVRVEPDGKFRYRTVGRARDPDTARKAKGLLAAGDTDGAKHVLRQDMLLNRETVAANAARRIAADVRERAAPAKTCD